MLSTFLFYVCLAAGKTRNNFLPLGPWKAELRTKNKRATPIYIYMYIYVHMNFKFLGKCILNHQEGGRLDAKRHYVI